MARSAVRSGGVMVANPQGRAAEPVEAAAAKGSTRPGFARLARAYPLPRRLVALTAAVSLALPTVGASRDWPLWLLAALALTPWLLLWAVRLRWTARRYKWLVRAFPHASPDLLLETIGRLQTRRYRRGEAIVAEGEPADRFYVVTAGEAEVIQRTGDRHTHICTYSPGQFFGEVGLLAAMPRNATVRAVSSVEVVSLDREGFSRVVENSDATADDLAQVLKVRGARAEPRSDAVPLPHWSRLLQRIFKHPRVMHYNRLIGLVLAVNWAVLVYGLNRDWWTATGTALHEIALVAQANFALAIILRQQYVINALAWVATRAPASWPLRVRWALGKYYHFGGLHVGAAVAGTLWYLVLVISMTRDLVRDVGNVTMATVVVSWVIVVLFVVIVVLALPRLRAAAHDNFEVTHRFFGWLALLLVCVNTVLFVDSQRPDDSLPAALLGAPTVWMLVVAIGCALWPWLLLRRVPITLEQPSKHAVIVKLDHDVRPGIGTTRPISRHPLIGWHHFANLPAVPGEPGYRMVISRAGDWTSAFIDDPPPYVWVRGIPTIGVANVRKLFKKVVFVATGSGIGPMLAHLLTREPPSRLVWVTKNPRVTYGDALLDEIMTAQPDAVIWNTDERGKPDVLRLAYASYLDSGAEAVICICNKTVTWQVVHGLERRGIPAFGPIWDS